mgnify:CR=1 FL=1
MRAIVLVLGLGALGACHDPAIGPDPDGTTTSTGAGASGAGGGASGGGGDGAGGGNAQALGYTNGSRLRARVLHGDDGAAQFYGWHDSELDVDCYFQQTSDGQTRCIPAIGGSSGYFADPACTIPVVGVASCVAPGARYAYVSRAVGCSTVFDIHKIGAEVTGPTVYYGIAGCTPTGVGASAWFLDDGIEPPGSFVAAHESVD